MAIIARSATNYQVEISAGKHTFLSDEPLDTGDDAGPSPFDMVLSGLASCTIITLKMYARRKNWPLERVELVMDVSSREVLAGDGSKSRSSVIESRLTFFGPLTVEQIRRLEEIADRCPVHRMLIGDLSIQSSVSNLL
jgi:putative redox protein